MLSALTNANQQLDQANRAKAVADLRQQAQGAVPMRLAREAARQAVERSFAMPLLAAGFKDVKVVARFPRRKAATCLAYLDLSTPYEEAIKEAERGAPRRGGNDGPDDEFARARPARRDRAAETRAQRRDPRPLLPEAGNPGPRRFRRRQPRSVAQGGGDRRRSDRVLRRPLHGRDGEDPLAREDRDPARHGRRLSASRTAARPTSSRRFARRTRTISRSPTSTARRR